MEGSPKDQHRSIFFCKMAFQGRANFSFHRLGQKMSHFCEVRFVKNKNCNKRFGFVYATRIFVLLIFKINFYIFARICVCIYIRVNVYRRQSITPRIKSKFYGWL